MDCHPVRGNQCGGLLCSGSWEMGVVSSGGAPTPAGTSVFTKRNWDMGMGYL